MSRGYLENCPVCRKLPLVEFTTSLRGDVIEKLVDGCEHVRQKMGICRYCPAPVKTPRVIYCAGHKRRFHTELARKARKKAKILGDDSANERRRAAYARDPEPAKAARKKWYEENKEAVRERERAKFSRAHPDYEKRLAGQRDRYQRHIEARRATAIARYWRKREQILEAYRDEDTLRFRRRYQAKWKQKAAARGHIPTPTRRNADGQRLCLTDGCPSVLTGSPKVCAECRERFRAESAA